MQTPNINPNHKYFEYWTPIQSGKVLPDEWQSALMDLVEEALSEGIFYSKDMRDWVKDHASFIPIEWWDYQYKNTPVEGGIMGMEVYSARKALEEKQKRTENENALNNINVDDSLGTLSVNFKRVNKCVVKAIDGYTVIFTGVTGRYPCEVKTEARNISNMVSRAINSGWRK